MALARLPSPPSPQQKVDDDKGVFYSWHEWFTRLWRWLNDLYDLVLSIQVTNTTIVQGGDMVPYFIAPTEEFIVPIYKQALFEMTIDNQGILTVDGFLIQVS